MSLSPWKVNNFVVHFSFPTRFIFKNMVSSSSLSYEPELFPALLMTKWHGAHVTLFPNGEGILTGVRDGDSVKSTLQDVLYHSALVRRTKW